jgi:type IV pilus assembly protein PilC
MPNFAYVAKSRTGEELSGVVTGASVDQVVEDLHRRGLVVLHVAEEALGWRGRSSLVKKLNEPIFGGVSTRDLALFTRQVATLFEAGIPLTRGLRGLAKDESNKHLSRVVRDVAETVESGNNLADALGKHPRVFNQLYVSMVRAGEGAGTLDVILEELAVYLEKVDAIKTKVRSAMSYPSFVFIFAIGVSLFLLLKIVPTFEQIYADFNAVLPAPTQAVIGFSRLIRNNIMMTSALLLTLMFLGFLWSRTPTGLYLKDLFLIRMPVFGPIIKKAVISRMTRTFGILLQSGLPVLEALDLVKGATGNEAIARAITHAQGRVAKGEEITPAFRSSKRFPEMTLQLMDTGEETGALDAMLIKNSEFYDRQVEASVAGLTALIEPLLIVIVGVIVGIVVITMFLPIFYLGDAIMHGAY